MARLDEPAGNPVGPRDLAGRGLPGPPRRGAVRRRAVAGVLSAGMALLLSGAGHAADVFPEMALDVGGPGDADPTQPAYLVPGPGLSEPLVEGDRAFRTLDPGATMTVHVSADGMALSAEGVPGVDAVVDVVYRDVVDEEDCSNVKSTRAYCRPRLATRLDYGRDRVLDWWPVGGLGGLRDEAWKQERIHLEATPWQTLRAIGGTFQFSLSFPRQLSGGVALPLDSFALRFLPRAAFEASREADRAARGLVRAEFEESVSPDALERGSSDYLVYLRHPLAKVYPNSVPTVGEAAAAARGLSVREVAGEREPATLAVYAFEALRAVSVSVSDLVMADGRGTIPAGRIAVHRVGVLDKRWGYGYDAAYGANPWVLLDAEPHDVPSGSSAQWWLTIDVPIDAPPGAYAGTVRVEVGDAAATPVPIALEVLGVELAAPAATPYLYHSPYLPGKHFAPTFLTALRDMAAHDIHPIVYLDAAIDLADHHVDLRDLDRELDDLRALGILPDEPRVGVSDNARSLYRRLCPGAGDFLEACPAFDAVYLDVLGRYRAAFEPYGVVPALSFTDEPGNDPERRVVSNYLHRLARRAGMRTWVTYYPRCEEPLAGHTLAYRDLVGGIVPVTPRWLAEDERRKGHWDFTYGPMDRTDYANHGQLAGGARTQDGVLALPDASAYMRVADADWLDLPEAMTFALWMRPAACPTGYATQPLSKWAGTEAANYVLYWFGDYDGRYPESLGVLQAYANAGGRWTGASGRVALDCAEDLGQWVHVLWTYDATAGGRLVVNGVPRAGTAAGRLAENDAPLLVGRFAGEVDDVLVLDRALSDGELARLASDLNAGYDRSRLVDLTAVVTDTAAVPPTLTFSIHDASPAPVALETSKALLVNGIACWSARDVGPDYPLVTVDVASLLREGETNTVAFRFTNLEAREETVQLYLVDEAWRSLAWASRGDGHWRHEQLPDPSGALGPMDPELDDRVYAMRYVTAREARATRAAGDSFSYYTTYPATQPALVNNRFLNGIYAAATGAEGVYVYAYGDWGSQPWDDTEPSYVERIGNATARRSQNNYQLVLPSWEDRVYDTLAFEMLREGIEDARVIATLQRAIATHPGPTAREAKAYLDDLLDRPSPDFAQRYLFNDPEAPIERYADRGGEMLSDLAGRPDAWAFFDDQRWRMLRYVVALEAAPRAAYLPALATR